MTGGTQRLYVALPAPADLAQQAAALPRTLRGAHWAPPGALHITLRFLGDLDPERAQAAAQALALVRRAPFTVAVAGLGLFAHVDGDVLYARVESVRAVTDLCARVTDRLTPLGFDFGARPYVPHVTLARLPPRMDLFKYMKINDKKIRCQEMADEFHLLRSGPDGADAPCLTVALRP